jgi:hypothetical protein
MGKSALPYACHSQQREESAFVCKYFEGNS